MLHTRIYKTVRSGGRFENLEGQVMQGFLMKELLFLLIRLTKWGGGANVPLAPMVPPTLQEMQFVMQRYLQDFDFFVVSLS